VIKSIDELMRIRDRYRQALQNRETNENNIRILVGMATCGIAAGARDTINALVDEIRKQGVDNAVVVQTGCVGFCYAEPIVDVVFPNQPAVRYAKVDAHKAREIVRRHIRNNEVIQEWILKD